MQIDYKERLAELIAFLLLIEIFYFYDTYMNVGGFGVGLQYIGCILSVMAGFVWFLMRPDPMYLYGSIKTAGTLMLSYFVALIYSLAIWTFSFTPVRQMISGFFSPAYMILCILCAAFLAYILRERLAAYSFWALTMALLLLVIPKMLAYGVPEFFRRLAAYVGSMGVDGQGVSLEASGYSYIYVFFAIYFLFHWKETPARKRFSYVAVISFAMLVVFKRSALLALLAGAAAAFLYFRLEERARRWFLYVVAAGFLLFALFYIPIIRYGLFNRIMESLQINTSYRDVIYDYYARYYEFGPSYMGKGLGWMERLISEHDVFSAGLASVDVHCDYVRLYIELGFWGYLFWIVSVFPWVINTLVKQERVHEDAVILGVSMAMVSLRITENISELYSAVLGFSIVVVQCSLNGRHTEDKDTPGG